MLLGLFYLEYQSLGRGGMRYLGMVQNPFERYRICDTKEFAIHKPCLRACVYDGRKPKESLDTNNNTSIITGKQITSDSDIPTFDNMPDTYMQPFASTPGGNTSAKISAKKSGGKRAWAKNLWRQWSEGSGTSNSTAHSDSKRRQMCDDFEDNNDNDSDQEYERDHLLADLSIATQGGE